MDHISSVKNDMIKRYRRLCESKRERTRSGLFVLEGARLVSDCIENGFVPENIFIEEGLEDKYRFAADNARTVTISREVSGAIAQTVTSQGIYAICRLPEKKHIDSFEGGGLLILDDLQDPGNLGTIIRTADAFGISLALCGCCDEFSPKTVRSAMGSVFRVTMYSDSFEDTIKHLRSMGMRIYASVIDSSAVSILDANLSSAAVVIGNEGSGMPEEHIKMCDDGITIKMTGSINSLNAAMAAGIFIWELHKDQQGG